MLMAKNSSNRILQKMQGFTSCVMLHSKNVHYFPVDKKFTTSCKKITTTNNLIICIAI